MELVKPWLESIGFQKTAGDPTGDRFDLVADDGACLALAIEVRPNDDRFRMWCSWENSSGVRDAYGPDSFPYECPNHPGKRRYLFRFHRDPETHERCFANIRDWVRNELLPWFASRPSANWSNPNLGE